MKLMYKSLSIIDNLQTNYEIQIHLKCVNLHVKIVHHLYVIHLHFVVVFYYCTY